MSRPGRPPGPLKGRTPEANALARFLRELTAEDTVSQLEERYQLSRSVWSEYRSGVKIIPLARLNQLIENRYPRDARTRTDKLQQACRLHTAATTAAPTPASPPTPAAPLGPPTHARRRRGPGQRACGERRSSPGRRCRPDRYRTDPPSGFRGPAAVGGPSRQRAGQQHGSAEPAGTGIRARAARRAAGTLERPRAVGRTRSLGRSTGDCQPLRRLAADVRRGLLTRRHSARTADRSTCPAGPPCHNPHTTRRLRPLVPAAVEFCGTDTPTGAVRLAYRPGEGAQPRRRRTRRLETGRRQRAPVHLGLT